MHQTYSEENFHHICDLLGEKDSDLKAIVNRHGYPPMWSRPNIFQTLILTILEQQVSLASAYAAYKKLKEKIGFVTPGKILQLSADELRACYFSRQKIVYAKELATAIEKKKISLKKLLLVSDDEIRTTLKGVKGIGDWTVDIYLIHALHRTDLFPLGDVALVNSLKEIKHLGKGATKDEMLALAESWRPYRTIATIILWHHTLLVDVVSALIHTDEKEKEFLCYLFTEKQNSKGDFFLKEGNVCREVGFITRGLVRYFINKDGEELIYDFGSEGNFVCNYESFLDKSPSQKNIQFTEDTEWLSISFDKLQLLYKNIAQGERFGRLVCEQIFIDALRKITSLYTYTPEQRYHQFLELYPDLQQRIPQYYVSSFVGVKPQAPGFFLNLLT